MGYGKRKKMKEIYWFSLKDGMVVIIVDMSFYVRCTSFSMHTKFLVNSLSSFIIIDRRQDISRLSFFPL